MQLLLLIATCLSLGIICVDAKEDSLCLRYPTSYRQLCKSDNKNQLQLACDPFVGVCSALTTDTFMEISKYMAGKKIDDAHIAEQLVKSLSSDTSTNIVAVQTTLHHLRRAPVLVLAPANVPTDLMQIVLTHVDQNNRKSLDAVKSRSADITKSVTRIITNMISSTAACYNAKDKAVCDVSTLQRFHMIVDVLVVWLDLNREQIIRNAVSVNNQGTKEMAHFPSSTLVELLKRLNKSKVSDGFSRVNNDINTNVFSNDMIVRLLIIDILTASITTQLNSPSISFTKDERSNSIVGSVLAQLISLPKNFEVDNEMITQQEIVHAMMLSLRRMRTFGDSILVQRDAHPYIFSIVAKGFTTMLRPIIDSVMKLGPSSSSIISKIEL